MELIKRDVSLFDLSQNVSALNKELKYSDALKYFKENKKNFSNEQIASNAYLVGAMLTALRKTGNIDSAFKFLSFYNIKINGNTNDRILNSYGWLLYSKFKSENLLSDTPDIEEDILDDDEIETADYSYSNKDEIVKLIESFLPIIIKIDNEFSYSVASKLIYIVLKSEKNKLNTNYQFINSFCDLVNPELLHTDCQTIETKVKGAKKLMELASDKENWYAYKSKALNKLGMDKECLDVSKKALDLFEKFHYSNDVWFARRIALSKKNLGNTSDAIEELLQVLKRKKDWFIKKELAALYKENGDIEKAFSYGVDAINSFGDLEFKIDLIFLLGELLILKNESELGYKHFSLSYLIRINQEWKIPEKLNEALLKFNTPNKTVEDLPELKNELKNYWLSFLPKKNNLDENKIYSGKIERILHNDSNGADGFIKYEGNKSLYFSLKASDVLLPKLQQGMDVSFKKVSGMEGKKDKAIRVVAK